MATKWKMVSHRDAMMKRVRGNADDTMKELKDFIVEAIQEKILYGYHDVHGDPPHTEIVDTGALFDDVTAEVKKSSQNVWTLSAGNTTKIPYAGYVHDGTSKLKGRPYISDAFLHNTDKIEEMLEEGMKKDMQ